MRWKNKLLPDAGRWPPWSSPPASDKPGYVCDFKVDSESLLGRSERAASARFVKGDDGWEIVP